MGVKCMIPINYIGWTFIILAVLRLKNIAILKIKWRLAFSTFTAFYSLGQLSIRYGTPDLTNIFYFLSAAAIIIPFLKIDFRRATDIERICDASMFLGIGIIVLLS